MRIQIARAFGPTVSSIRSRISPAALFVNVIARISFGFTPQAAIRWCWRPGPSPRTLAAALAQLPHRQRAAVTLFDVEGYAHAEIAAILGVPEGTVRSDVFHARRTLRKALRVYGPEPTEE